jgi:ParB-like chromosome segregation protein Spo0J
MKLKSIPIEEIYFDSRNPRTDAAEGLDELVASMQGGELIVQPPILILAERGYRVLVGERRVRAAKASGAEEITCLVQEVEISAVDTHRVRLVENLHRKALSPIDYAAALRVSWLVANARELGAKEGAEAILADPGSSVLDALPKLEQLLVEVGFTPTAPARTWEQVLDELGVAMSADRRRKLLRVLAIPQDVQVKLQEIEISEAAVRALGRLEEDQQREVTEHLLEKPELARRVRRIARAVGEQEYSVEEAVAEAEGRIIGGEESEDEELHPPLSFEDDQAVADAVLRFLENANQLVASLSLLQKEAPSLLDIPEPWRAYYQQSLAMLREELS